MHWRDLGQPTPDRAEISPLRFASVEKTSASSILAKRSKLLIALAFLTLALLAPADFGQLVQAQGQVEFTSTHVAVDFPQTIEFTMTARGADVEGVQVFWRPAGSTATTMADAQFTTEDEVITATYSVDTRVRYLPPGLDLEYFWRVTTSDRTVHQSDTQTFLFIDNRFEWDTVEAGSITVFWYRGTREFAEEIAFAANRTLVTLQDQFDISTDLPIRIVIYGNDRDFSSAMRPNSADWIGGVAYSSLSLVIAQLQPGTGATREIGRMIPHEVAHVVIHHAGRNPYNSPPPWLDEGLATWIQETPDTRLEPILDRATREGRLIPIPALRSSFPLDPDQAMLSYAQSLSVVSYLIETYGTQTAGDLVSIYQDEVTHDQAIEQTLGLTIDDLDASWKEWLGYPGDRVDDPMAAASATGSSTIWFLLACGFALFFSGGLVGYFFWRTRSYAEQSDEINPAGVVQGDDSPTSQH